MPAFVCIQSLECIPAQAQPRSVGIVGIHHVAPNLQRHVKACFLFPGDLVNLQRPRFISEKDGSAEVELDGNETFSESLKIFGHAYIEIERARNLKSGYGAAAEGRNDEVRIGPEHAVQSLVPLRWLTEQVGESSL